MTKCTLSCIENRNRKSMNCSGYNYNNPYNPPSSVLEQMTPRNHASEGGKQTQVFVTPPSNSITPNSFEGQNKLKRDNAVSNFYPKKANGPIKNLR